MARLSLVACLLGAIVGAQVSRADSGFVSGPDVADYQHPGGAPIDWGAVARSGARFVFIKATEGASYVNPYFPADWSGAGAAGLIRGAYSYAHPALPLSTAAEQASFFVNVAGTTRQLGDLPPVLDLEDNGGLSPVQLVAWTHRWLDAVQRLTGRLAILYTGAWFWDGATGGDSSFGAYPLWESAYSSAPPAPLPGWSGWTFWQHTDAASYPGIATAVDDSYLCCGVPTLAGLSDGRTPQIVRTWAGLGGASGPLGLPVGFERAVRGGWAQTYQHGMIVWTSRYGPHAVLGPLYPRLAADGGPDGAVGVPVADQVVTRHGRLQRFTGGAITFSASTGAHAVLGRFYARWVALGGMRGGTGLPTTEVGLVPGGASQQFARAGLYAGARGPVFAVPGPIRDRYEYLGGPSSVLGLPTSNAYRVPVGRQVSFRSGWLTEVDTGGRSLVV